MPLMKKDITPTYIDFYRQFKHPLKYCENLQKILDARATKKENILRRKNLLDHKRKIQLPTRVRQSNGITRKPID